MAAEKRSNPRVRITDPKFVYRDSAHTNVALTFARVRREMKAAAQPSRVVSLRGAK